ncbi:hypothetical protein DPV78_011730 [Talaromyces pinophilus]|nr:hypothetical protein DPV78_011730 [Talaromyces pinophilus]
MENRALAHVHFHQKEVYDLHEIHRLLWPGNSPDLNAIEPAWFWLKRRTTLLGAPGDRETAKKVWLKAWDELPQDWIRVWIERILFHIEEIIRLEGESMKKVGLKEIQGSAAARKGCCHSKPI